MISSLIYSLPFLFCFSFMVLLSDGPSIMSKMVIFCSVLFFILNYKDVLKKFNLGWFEYKYFILSILFFAASSLIFHQLHGDYMAVVRAAIYFILLALATAFFYKKYVWRWVEFSLVLGSVLIFTYSFYTYYILGSSRVGAYINEIIFAQAIFPLFLINATLSLRDLENGHKLGFTLHFLSSFLCVACLVWSGTRGVWLALPVVLCVYAYYIVQRGVSFKTIVKAIVCLLLVLTVLFGKEISFRYEQAKNDISLAKTEQNISGSSLGGRFYVWHAALMMAKEAPLFGVGRDNFENKISEYVTNGALEPQQQIFPHAHNGYLNALAMNGLIGLLSYIIFVFSPLLLIKKERIFSLSSFSLLSLVLSYATFSLSDVPFIYQINIYVYLFSAVFLFKLNDKVTL